MYQKITTLKQAMDIAAQAENEDLNGVYPAALRLMAEEIKKLYVCIEMPSDEPVNFVGVHPLAWGKDHEPTAGFVDAVSFIYDE